MLKSTFNTVAASHKCNTRQKDGSLTINITGIGMQSNSIKSRLYDSENIQYLSLWGVGAVLCLFLYTSPEKALLELLSPLLICIFTVLILININLEGFARNSITYLLFFSITITSYWGITQTLSGSYTGQSNYFFYGFSFYTASLAYLFKTKSKLILSDSFKISNPILLMTGPIAIFIKPEKNTSLKRRINYYLPFVLVGIFFFQIIAAPLTHLFFLLSSTDIISTLCFAIIFEIFVYTNFCGLSLIIYGIFGLLGYRVPLNFKQPFSSSNIIEFWRGWHLSLSMVLKLLFYSPVRKNFPSYIAIFFVFMASGLWHGISFNYIIWALFHSFIFLTSLYCLKRKIRIIPFFLLFLGIIMGRLIAAESDTDRLLEKFLFIYSDFTAVSSIIATGTSVKISLILGLSVIFIEKFFQKHKLVAKRNYKFLRTPLALVFIIIITTALIHSEVMQYAVYGQR
jgi:D-alanyl-lipoteichoic acid acyltransferase DltB (MBOAT superfamily)